ncbi:MAG: hypothetical protein K2X29_12040 [Candidatus Obscuribacterales bacterium]|nr:hypothetical protein [Candidatus Obscuribacterales bacterium]
MISKKLAADMALVCAIFLATAGIVEAQKTYHGYIDPAFIDFQLRSQTLQGRINDGLESGGLTKSEADDLTSQLRSIDSTTESTTTKTSTGRLNARLHSQLDKLSSQVDLTMKDRSVVNSSIAEIVAKKAAIQHQLSATSPIRAARIARKLERISAWETYLLSNHSGLTYWQRKKINADLDLLSSQLSAGRSKVSFASQ